MGYNDNIHCVRIFLDDGHISVYHSTTITFYAERGNTDKFYNFVTEEEFIPENLVGIPDDEFFQLSLVWNYPVDIYLFKRVQEFFKSSFPEHTGNKPREWFQTFGSTNET